MKRAIEKLFDSIKSKALKMVKKSKILLFIVVFGVIGLSFIFVGRAASPATSFETETALLGSGAVTGSDANASGGKYIEFRETATTPDESSFPTDATTGYKSCGKSLGDLTPMSGSITLAAGETLENFDLDGSIRVTGPNVTIRCGRIRTTSLYAITTARNGTENYLMEGVEMEGYATDTSNNSAAVSPYGEWVLSRVNIWRFKDGIKLGSNHTVQDSWIHDLKKTDGSHNDGMQSVGGINVNILRNNIEGPWQTSTSALILGAGTVGILDSYTIEGNRLSGGTFTVYIGGKTGNPTPSNMKVRNNVWVKDSWQYGSHSFRLNWPEGDTGAEWSGNTFSDGTPFNL